MNDKFERLLKAKGWEYRECNNTGTPVRDYIKVFNVQVDGEAKIPISVKFINVNKDAFPIEADFKFVLDTECSMSWRKKQLTVKGYARIIVMLDLIGQMMAINYAAFGYQINKYTQPAKQILNEQIQK